MKHLGLVVMGLVFIILLLKRNLNCDCPQCNLCGYENSLLVVGEVISQGCLQNEF